MESTDIIRSLGRWSLLGIGKVMKGGLCVGVVP